MVIVIIALLLVGGAYYANNKSATLTPNSTGNSVSQQSQNAKQTTSSTSVTLTTADICSPLLKDASTLLFTDNYQKSWTVDYRNASFSEYSYTTGKVNGTDGLLKTTLQDWLKSIPSVGMPKNETCNAPGKITITGTRVDDVVFATHIELSGQ